LLPPPPKKDKKTAKTSLFSAVAADNCWAEEDTFISRVATVAVSRELAALVSASSLFKRTLCKVCPLLLVAKDTREFNPR
jgi:hypothetical protein